MPTRKVDERGEPVTISALLQWGRVVADAEGSRGPRRRGSRCTASMGPRRCRRGRSTDHELHRRGDLRFNGAASLPTRKGRRRLYAASRGRQASMGPRRCRRGRDHPRAERGHHRHASMGPRRCRRGRSRRPGPRRTTRRKLQWGRVVADAEGCSSCRPGHHGAWGFNGAASLPTRKAASPWRPHGGRPAASMGPRRCRRGRRRGSCRRPRR